jgi:signal transduction histidine kinase
MKPVAGVLLILSIALSLTASSQKSAEIDNIKAVLINETEAKVSHFFQCYEQLMTVHDYTQARLYLDSVFNLSEKLHFEQGVAWYYNGMGLLLYKEKNYQEALNNYRISLKSGKKTGDSLHVARVCLNLGTTYNTVGNFEQALIYLKMALRIAESMGYRDIQKAVLDKITIVYTFLGNYPEAKTSIEKALAMAEESGDTEGVFKSTLNLGIIYKHQGNVPRALEVFTKALPYYEQTGNKEVLIALDNCIGTIYLHLNEYQEAHRHLSSALEFSRELGVTSEVASNLCSIGLVYCAKQDLDAAVQYELQALEIYSKIGHKEGLASAWLAMGEIYEAKGDPDKALESYHKSLNYSQEISDKYNEVVCLTAIGNIMFKQATRTNAIESRIKYDKARDNFKESLKLSKRMDKKDIIMNIYRSLYRIDSATGNYEGALKNYILYENYRDSLYNIESSNRLAAIQVQFVREQKNQEINLLTREKEITSLQLKNQQAALLTAKLKTELSQNQILMLGKSREFQKINLERTAKELEAQKTVFREQKSLLESTLKIKDLTERELRQQRLQRNGILFTTILFILVAVLIFRSLQLRRKLEKQEAVAKERERISADLHDDIGSGLTKIILMLEVLNNEMKTPEVKNKTSAISRESLELSKNMSEVIWALNSRNDSLESLVAYIRKYASSYFENSPVHFKMTAPAHFPHLYLSSEQRRNIFYVVKEALHNIVKHASARGAEVVISLHSQILELIIRDDGIGMPDGELNRFGNGIIHMRSRLQEIGGEFSIESDDGTSIKLSMPVRVK